jgi:hypothetical protein
MVTQYSARGTRMKKMVCAVDVISRGTRIRFRYRRVHTYKVHVYELHVIGNRKKFPAWKLVEVVSVHKTPAETLSAAKVYAETNSTFVFYSKRPPAKYARQNELQQAFGFDKGTPLFILRDRLLEEGLEITAIRGDTVRE